MQLWEETGVLGKRRSEQINVDLVWPCWAEVPPEGQWPCDKNWKAAWRIGIWGRARELGGSSQFGTPVSLCVRPSDISGLPLVPPWDEEGQVAWPLLSKSAQAG